MTGTMIITPSGREYLYDLLVGMMDDDIREEIHHEMAPCSPQAFADAYAERHDDKYGEAWEPYKESPQL